MFQDILMHNLLNLPQIDFLAQSLLSNGSLEIVLDSDDASKFEDECKHTDAQSFNKESTQEANALTVSKKKKQKQKKKRVRKYTSNNPNNQKGHWIREQCIKYHVFLQLNVRYFIDIERRKTDKIFKSMASFIGSREAHQCRSHHQKIQEKWGSILNILLNLRIYNFNNTKKKSLIAELQKLGYGEGECYLLSEYQLMNQQQLYNKVLSQGQCKEQCIGEDQLQQNQAEMHKQLTGENLQLIGSHYKPNCLCLMSQSYEDQLGL